MTGWLARWAIVMIATVGSLAPVSVGAQGGSQPGFAHAGQPPRFLGYLAGHERRGLEHPGSECRTWSARRRRGLAFPASRGVVEGNEIPYQAWARAKKEENYKNRLTLDPEINCYLPGVPRITYMPFPFQIVQTPTYIAHAVRVRARDSPYLRRR